VRWFADECVHAVVVRELRAAGHDVVYAAEVARQAKDVTLANRAAREGRIFLTEDKDFGEIAFLNPLASQPIVLLRISSQRRHMKWSQLRAAIAEHGEMLARSFTVIGEARTRVRPLP
jgi:predicted nuclease of predicted toxin-antitoxin system